MIRSAAAFCFFLIAGCSSHDQAINDAIASQFKRDTTKLIDLSVVGTEQWERVCILTPYMGNAQVEKVLGFKWDAENKTSIAVSDGINVLVFIKDTEVVGYTEHPRNKGDFANVKPKCIVRDRAKFERVNGDDGWAYLKLRQ